MKVSIFENYLNPFPIGEIELRQWLLTNDYQRPVEAIRKEKDPEKRKQMKSALPAITPSGIFAKRCKVGLKRHSGFICVDIDGKENPEIADFSAVKSILAKKPYIYYSGLSVSGNGIFCLIPIAEPERHQDYFSALEKEFAGMGLIVDRSCKDVCRLRGVSYDPQPVFNEYAEPYFLKAELETQNHPSRNQIWSLNNAENVADRVDLLVEAIIDKRANIAESYSDWFAIGRSLASEFGEQGRRYFHAISRLSDKYNQTENDIQFDKCLRACNRTGIATLFYLCRNAGITLIN